MDLQHYNYQLPKKLISSYPPKIRGKSRLLTLNRERGAIEDKHYEDIASYLNSGDVLVINDSKVIKARFNATCEDGSTREIVLLEAHHDSNEWYKHKVIYRGKLADGESLRIGRYKVVVTNILEGGIATVESRHNLLDIAEEFGQVPLPPYMKRAANQADVQRYQTVWADEPGSVAAPTASLNMTNALLDKLAKKGVIICRLTLHVGLGTFIPIRVEDLSKHVMHKEYFEINESSINQIRKAKQHGNKVIALGTTVTRALEYSHKELLGIDRKRIAGEADIFIYPGYKFKIVDILITNFHAPKSTVLMMAAAFAGWDNLKKAYEHAIDEEYNFLSYGDSMLIY